MRPSQNCGIAAPLAETASVNRSRMLPGRSAAATPSGIAMQMARMSATRETEE